MIDLSAKLIQAEKEIKENLKDFDILTEFLGKAKKYFIREYSNFSSQLNEGDKLIVRISKSSERIAEGDYGDDYVYFPSFDIILLKSDGKTKILYSREPKSPSGIAEKRYVHNSIYEKE